MNERIIAVSVPMLESTLKAIKYKAGTNVTKNAICMAIDAYLDGKEVKK